ncbi:MAG: hypothetical protein M1832_003165 [Thelocarpon impressellum]|nr:MAG: hypothetical protein M1832_003165 [Thelocarpon impressellum]
MVLGTAAPGPAADKGSQQYNTQFSENFETSQKRGSSILEGPPLTRSDSTKSLSSVLTPSRGGTLKKKASLSRKSSLKRGGSRRNSRADSVRSLALGDDDGGERSSNVFSTPIPTSGSPTDILANRFQGWRKVLKDLIAYFREIQTSHEQRAKSLVKVTNVINNTAAPGMFLPEGGIHDAADILRDFHRQALAEGNKAREIETGVVNQLTGLRADLTAKIKEIKGLSGDFKNSVDKEVDATRKCVQALQEALELAGSDPSAVAGKGDPFIVKLAVDRQVERQIDEENYLHRAFLNLEGSGRELDSIVVGEIQKAYNVYAQLLRREADETYEAVERLRNGPIAMPKDQEWSSFVQRDEHFVDPRVPLRRVQDITYPGRNHPMAAEVRAGMLERKSKYLKSYTPGWYVLTSTHLHEFKSADRINIQLPVMSLYLPEQKLGTHSQPDSSSHKFMLKGRQTGAMHRGHSWVFRAESHDTMLAWYEDLRNLTEKTGAERNAFVRRHARSLSDGSQRAGSISSDGALDEDEADQVPYSASASSVSQAPPQPKPQRPSPGGRFPSDLQIDRGLTAERSPSSESSDPDRDVIAAAVALHGSRVPGAHGDAATEADAHERSGSGEVLSPQPRRYMGSHAPAAVPPVSTHHDVLNHGPETYASQAAPQQTPLGPGAVAGIDEGWAGPAAAGITGAAAGTATKEGLGQGHDGTVGPEPATEPQEIGSGTPLLAAAVTDSETRTQSVISAQPQSAATGSEPSQAGSVSTVPTTVDTAPEGNPTQGGQGAVQSFPGLTVADSQGKLKEVPGGSHVPGEYPSPSFI